VRAGHGGTRDGPGARVAVVPGTEDGATRSEDVDTGAEVGEGAASINLVGARGAELGGTDGDGAGGTSRGSQTGVDVVVTSGNGHQETTADGGVDSVVEGSGDGATERHVTNGGTARGLGTVSSPLNTSDDTGVGAAAVVTEDLDGVDDGLLGEAVVVTDGGGGNVSTVAVQVGVGGAGNSVVAPDSARAATGNLELVVGNADAGVNDVDINAVTIVGLVVELVVDGVGAGGSDAVKTPGSVVLNLITGLQVRGEDNLVGLNPLNEVLLENNSTDLIIFRYSMGDVALSPGMTQSITVLLRNENINIMTRDRVIIGGVPVVADAMMVCHPDYICVGSDGKIITQRHVSNVTEEHNPLLSTK